MDMQSNDERGAEKQMDDYLKTLGLHRKKIAKDGSCLFRAVAEQVLHCQSLHTKVRAQCVEFLKKNREVYEAFIEGDFEDYLCKLQDPQQWVGEVEINALAVMYKRDFLIYQEPGKPAVPITNNNFKDKVRLCFLNENHYDSVYPTSHIKSAAICQSILYELLYDNVFKVDPAALSNICNLTNRPNYVLSDDNLPPCVSSDESELDTSDVLRVENGTTSTKHGHKGRGRGRMSERLKRSLNPTLYRNVEFDVWHKTKRAQQKLDYCIAAGMQYSVGDRCQVRLEGGRRSYNATITEVPPNHSAVTVYIEELGKKQVPLWCVRHPSDETSWSTVTNREKRISNGHGEWDERGKGRGRGKSNTASSSVSQATAPGSGGRVQKQHSWPQVTAEEQGGTKTSRKSPSTSESVMFGLTEEERLAKEEEERNVALVEIQLRDEHSFPALGTQAMQGDGGKRKGGEKRKSQRSKTRSPVEDVSAGERPKSSTPPLATTTAPTKPTTNATKATNPTRPAAKPPAAASTNSESSPARLSSLKASTPSANMAAASGSTAKPPPACAALTTKPNTLSYASAAGGPPSSPPPPAPSAPTTKPPVAGGAPPHSVPSSASVFSFVTPVLPPASPSPSSSSPSPCSSSKLPTSSLSSLPPKSSASPPPSSSVSPPTFIAPIAPVAAQGFLPASSFPRSSLPRSPSPPSLSPSTVQISSSSSVNHHAAPSAPAQTPDSLPHAEDTLTAPQTLHNQSSLSQIHPQEYQSQSSVSQTQTQTSSSHAEITSQSSLSEVQIQSQASVPQNKVMRPQMQADIQCSVPQLQHQPQPHTEAASLPQTQTQPPVLQPQSQANYPSQTQSEFTQLQSSHPAPGASYPHIPQDPIPVSASVQPQPLVTQPHLQPPHPSQVPHPSLSLSAPLTHPSVQSQTPNTQDKVEAPPPAAQQLQAESPAHPPSQQSQPPHPPLHSAHTPLPPVPQAIPGTFPLQQLSQLFHDPLYPGFPQTENGSVAPTPPLSSSKSGDDLPQDVSILRFFFNLGVKAYTVPVFAPYVYLIPLQQAYTLQPMQPKLPSRSPSPTTHFSPSNPPARHQEAYPPYPPNSASVPTQYDQASLTEPPRPSEPSFNQAGYPVTHPPPHRISWQQQQVPPPRNSSYPAGLPSTAPPYPVSMPPQGYPSGQDPGHPPFAPTMTPYPPSSLGYHQSSTPEEFQASQTTITHLQPANGDTLAGHALGRVPGPLEGPAAANVANANNNRTMVAHGVNSYGFKKEQEESVLLVDPPLNNTPIHVTMTTMKPSSIPGSHDIVSKSTVSIDNSPSHVYRPTRKPYVKMETSQGSYLHPISMPDGLSVACSTEDDWEEKEVFNPPTSNHRGPRRGSRGGRGRGGYDVRGQQRRRQEVGTRYPHNQYGPPHGGQNWCNY